MENTQEQTLWDGIPGIQLCLPAAGQAWLGKIPPPPVPGSLTDGGAVEGDGGNFKHTLPVLQDTSRNYKLKLVKARTTLGFGQPGQRGV